MSKIDITRTELVWTGLYARFSTPHQHTIGMQLREFLERCRWQSNRDEARTT